MAGRLLVICHTPIYEERCNALLAVDHIVDIRVGRVASTVVNDNSAEEVEVFVVHNVENIGLESPQPVRLPLVGTLEIRDREYIVARD